MVVMVMFCCVDGGVVGGPLHCCYYYFVALVVILLAIALVLIVALPNTCLIQPSHRLLLLFLYVASHYSHFVACVLVNYYPITMLDFLSFSKGLFCKKI